MAKRSLTIRCSDEQWERIKDANQDERYGKTTVTVRICRVASRSAESIDIDLQCGEDSGDGQH